MNHNITLPVSEGQVLVDESLPPGIELAECECLSLSFEDDELAELDASHLGTATMLLYLGITVLFAWILRLLATALALRGAAGRWRGEMR